MSQTDPIFAGHVDAAGVLHLDARQAFRGYLRRLIGGPIELIVRRRRQVRSRRANAYWWGVVIPLIAEHCGYAPHEHEAVHDAVVRQLIGLRPDSDPRLQIRASTHDMSVDDFGVLIEHAIVWAAADLGVVIPDPQHAEPAGTRHAA